MTAMTVEIGQEVPYPGGGTRTVLRFGRVPESGVDAVRVGHHSRVIHDQRGLQRVRIEAAWESWEPRWLLEQHLAALGDQGGSGA